MLFMMERSVQWSALYDGILYDGMLCMMECSVLGGILLQLALPHMLGNLRLLLPRAMECSV